MSSKIKNIQDIEIKCERLIFNETNIKVRLSYKLIELEDQDKLILYMVANKGRNKKLTDDEKNFLREKGYHFKYDLSDMLFKKLKSSKLLHDDLAKVQVKNRRVSI